MHRLFRPSHSVRSLRSFRPPTLVVLVLALAGSLSSCHSSSGPAAPVADAAANNPVPSIYKPNPEDRSAVKKEPVAEYRIRTEDKLNESWFSVRLYETSKTMRYRVAMEFEGLTGEDTVKLPDLGFTPQPSIEKGDNKYACLIGFMDKDHKFREMKKVYITEKGQSLKITTLKHYVVTDTYQLVGE